MENIKLSFELDSGQIEEIGILHEKKSDIGKSAHMTVGNGQEEYFLYSDEKIRELAKEAVLELGDPDNIYVFGYGSLMWRPNFKYDIKFPTLLQGYRRELNVYSITYRGTPKAPGLVFGLTPGGYCHGITFKISKKNYFQEVLKIFKREMLANVYLPTIVKIETPYPFRALTFIVNEDSPQYSGPMRDESKIEIIKAGKGESGSCVDYVMETYKYLEENSLRDPDLAMIAERISK